MERDLLNYGILKQEQIKIIDSEAATEMNEAAQFAIESVYPDEETYYSGIYAEDL